MDFARTKLEVPPVRPGWVARPRLVAMLRRASAVARVEAPAGYGKTTALAEWARSEPARGWIGVDEADNDPARLAASLTAAVGATSRSDQGPVAAVVDALARRRRFALVVDDVHLLRSRAALDLLASVAERLPEGAVLALGTRSGPELPWSRWRARSMLLEVGPEALRLDSAEASAVVARMGGPELGAEEAALLEARTEGWAAGVVLAGRALAARAESGGRSGMLAYLRDVRAAHRWALDYLFEEVLARCPADDQELLMRSAVLERLSAPLVAAVSRVPGAAARFASLAREGLFLLPIDARGDWYRFHPLFAELLRLRLGQLRPGLEIELRRRAAALLEADGDLGGAVAQRIAAGEAHEAARLVEATAEEALGRGEIATFLSWTDKLPPALVAARPELAVRRAFCLLLQGRPAAESEAALAAAPFHAGGDAVRALISLFRGDVAAAAAWAARAATGEGTAAAFARMVLAAVRREGHGEEEAGRLLAEVAGGRSPFGATVALAFLASLEARGGRLDAARRLLDRALALAVDPEGRWLPVAGRALASLGMIAYEEDRLEEAGRLLRQALPLVEVTTRSASSGVYAALARVAAARGEWERAGWLLDRARERAREFDVTDEDDLAVEMEAVRVALAKGDLAPAAAWAEAQPPPSAERLAARRGAKYEAVLLARVRLAEGRAEEALRIADAVCGLELIGARPLLEAEADLVRGCALAVRGSEAEAQAAASRCLARAAALGLARLVREAPLGGAELLAAAAERLGGAARAWYRELVARASGPEEAEGAAAVLSRREREVLPFLRSDLTAAEIAERLFVSEHTVRSHLKAIYAKLDVHSRSGAVTRAEELGILRPADPG